MRQHILKVTFDKTNVASPQYFIRSGRAGTASANTTQVCGNGNNPANCSNSAVTALAAGYWYKVSGNINVTYSTTTDSTATLTALTYDGNNYSGAGTGTISKIDVEKASVSLGTVTATTNSIVINYTLGDNNRSGVGTYTCKYSSTKDTYNTNGNTVTDSSCTITGLAKIQHIIIKYVLMIN